MTSSDLRSHCKPFQMPFLVRFAQRQLANIKRLSRGLSATAELCGTAVNINSLLSIESGLCHTPQQYTRRDVLSTVLAFEPILCADIIGLHRHRMYTVDKRALAILIYKYSPDIAILYFSSLYSDILSCELILTDDDNRSAQCDGFCEYLSCHM